MHARKCGFYCDAARECRCTPGQIQQYFGKISGPLLDRIDIHVEVPAVPFQELRGSASSDSSADMRARVERARSRSRILSERAISDPPMARQESTLRHPFPSHVGSKSLPNKEPSRT